MCNGNLLCVARDEQLLATRVAVLSARYCVTGLSYVDEMNTVAHTEFDLVLVCHSLSSTEMDAAIDTARRCWPRAKLLEITEPISAHHTKGVDAQVASLDGPRALLRAVEQLLSDRFRIPNKKAS